VYQVGAAGNRFVEVAEGNCCPAEEGSLVREGTVQEGKADDLRRTVACWMVVD
jgi:hypothetical protein